MAAMGGGGAASRDDVVVKSPTDRRSYRILRLRNGLTAVIVHDPEIYPDGVDPPAASEAMEEDGDEESEGSEGEDFDEDDEKDGEEDDEEEGDEDDEEEEDGEEAEEDGFKGGHKKGKGIFPTKKAAAAMCVEIGSFSDPHNAQGLAHFLEHMLFMGSSEFPDENEYDSYLSKHGGSSNAYTETEYTCYHFEVNREYLKGALNRFSQFFISPLVKAEAMEREVQSVESEFNQVLQSDSCRLFQLHCHTASPGHPFNRFFWGNKKSLVDAMEHGVNLREEILQLYQKNYHGGLMKLVVIGGEPLDTLENWVVELFDNVKTGSSPKASFTKGMPIWKAGKIYRLEAVKDVHTLDLTWTLPCLHKEYLKKPDDYIAHLLGHEGRGSLLYFLKAKGWATTLSAGVGDEGMHRSSVAYVFVVSIHLTDFGLKMLYDVVAIVYQYLKMLQQSSPQEWIFKELQDIGNMEFRFAEEQPQDEYASELAESMLLYSDEHIIYGQYVVEQWDPELIHHVLSFFAPENMRIDLVSSSFDNHSQALQHEPWFGTRFIEEDIPEALLNLWSNSSEIDPSLHLPSRNEFIPSDFSLRNANVPHSNVNIDHPKCIIDTPMIKLWYKLDTVFNVPRANTFFIISVKDGYSSLKNQILTDLLVNLIKDELNEILYEARMAKLDTYLSIVGDKLELKLYGFNDKLPVLISKILKLSTSFVPKANRFQVIKEQMERTLRNTNLKPLSHSSYLRLKVLREKFWGVDDKLLCLTNLSISDLVDFIPKVLSELHIEGLCHGNLSEEEALHISNIFTTAFSAQPLPEESRHQERIMCIPSGSSLIKSVHVVNKLEVNSVLELYFQIEQDIGPNATRLRALTDLFGSIIQEPCFDQLRTKEQLGYIVDCGPRMTYRILGFCFRVQSAKYSPVYLHNRVQNFITDVQRLLDELDDESFQNHRNGLIAEKLEKDPSLVYETGNLWGQIVDKRYCFDMPKQEVEELKNLQRADVVSWYRTYLTRASPRCRPLAVHIWGCNTNFKEEGPMQAGLGTAIEDIESFKSSQTFYPSIC